MTLFLGNEDVQAVLDMRTCLEAMEEAYRELVDGRAGYRPRIDFYVPPDGDGHFYRWGTMEGTSRRLGVFAIRMKSDKLVWNREGPVQTEEKYCIEPGTYCGLILLLSTRNGQPLAMIKDGYLQHMRVGACAGLGAKYLAREDAESLGMLGSGGMARTYAEAICQVRPIRRIKVFSPTRENRDLYVREMGERLGLRVIPADSAQEAVRGADIVACATDSLVPVMRPEWVEPGMHITNVRANEAGPEVLARVDLVARLGAATLPATGGVPGTMQGSDGMLAFHVASQDELEQIPRAPLRESDSPEIPTVPDIMAGRSPGRRGPNDVTFLNNQGTQGLQFAAVGGKTYELARTRGLGQQAPLEWFTQDIRD